MASVKHWLDSILLPQYLEQLTSNGYNTLRKCTALTPSELDRIGISLPGHKKRILSHLVFDEQLLSDSAVENTNHINIDETNTSSMALCSSSSSSNESIYENVSVFQQTLTPTAKVVPPENKTLKKKIPVPTPRISVQTKQPKVEPDALVPISDTIISSNNLISSSNFLPDNCVITGTECEHLNTAEDGTIYTSNVLSSVGEADEEDPYAEAWDVQALLYASHLELHASSEHEILSSETIEYFDQNLNDSSECQNADNIEHDGTEDVNNAIQNVDTSDQEAPECRDSEGTDSSYMEIWNCKSNPEPVSTSTEHPLSAGDGQLTAVHRDVIQSDTSVISPMSSPLQCSVGESPSPEGVPPLPPKLSVSDLPSVLTVPSSVDASPRLLLPSRVAPQPPVQRSNVSKLNDLSHPKMCADNSQDDVFVLSSETEVGKLAPAVRRSQYIGGFNIPAGSAPLSDEFEAHYGHVYPKELHPQPMIPSTQDCANELKFAASAQGPSQKQVEDSSWNYPKDGIYESAYGGGGAGVNVKPLRTPPVLPQKKKPDNVVAGNFNPYSLAASFEDEDTGDEELDDTNNTSFADSDGALSDGGEFYGFSFQRPPSNLAVIPIVKTAKTKITSRRGFLFKLETPGSVTRLGSQWKKFWVTFDGVSLKYFSSNKSFVSRRIIPVSIMLNIEQDIKIGEAHNFRFQLSTIDRVYTFGTDDADSLSLWTSVIMQTIIEAKVDVDSFIEGGDMSNPDMEGFVRMEGVKGKVYLAIKKCRLCYYKTIADFKAFTPIHQVEMQTASVKEISKCRLQLHSPHVAFVFLFDSSEELNRWKEVLEESISRSLGDDVTIAEVYKNHSNRFCADCSAPDPDWASVTLCITLCKRCAGVHRSLSVSKVRSLRMDFKVWKPSVVQLMTVIGNDAANKFWAWNLPQQDRIDSLTDDSGRKTHIYNKYSNRIYCQRHPLHSDRAALSEALCKSVQFEDIFETMQILFSGADIFYASRQYGSEPETPMQLAKKANQSLQMEFIYQNGGERFGDEQLYETVSENKTVSDFSHRGYLQKTGSNTKGDFRRRWCVLENGVFSYYDNEKSTMATSSIDQRDMLGVGKTTDDRTEFAFELATRGGRVYLFAADSAEDREAWVHKLGRLMAAVKIKDLDQIGEFSRGGNVFSRVGSTSDWYATWCHLNHNVLSVYNKEEHFDEYDLRKAKSVAFVQLSEKCLEAFDEGPPVVVDMPNGRALYIQSDIQRETETWLSVLQKVLMDVSNILSNQPLSVDDVPLAIEKCTNFIATYGLSVEGIYRISGQHSRITHLLEQLSSESRTLVLKPEDYQVHDVTNALRRYIRSLNEPLLTEKLRVQWIEIANLSNEDNKLQQYKKLISALPSINFNTLKRIITHLARVAELEAVNKMSVINLASIFGPILTNVDQSDVSSKAAGYGNTNHEIVVVKDLIEHHRDLFEIKEEELQHERNMEQAAIKIQQLFSQSDSVSTAQEDLLIGFHINSHDGDIISLKVSQAMRAHEVLAFVLDKAKLDANSACWSLFEIVCDGQLERPLHCMEVVVDVTLKWATWPAEFCRAAFLCVKHNYVYEAICGVPTPQMSLFCELRYAEKKAYRKYSFEFSRYSLSYRSSSKAAVPTASWNIEDLVIYVGMQQQRNPPTKWGFTFYPIAEKLTSPYFGQSVCCSNEQELYRWLAAMLYAQHPEGLLPNGPNGPTAVQPNQYAAAVPCPRRDSVDERSGGSPSSKHRWKLFRK